MQLREWRKAKSISMSDLSRLVGLAESTLFGYENGSRKPSPDRAKRIETATNGDVTAVELLGLDTPIKSLAESPAPYTSNVVSITIPQPLFERAKDYSLDIAALIAQGGLPRLRDAVRASFEERNAEAFSAKKRFLDEHGTLAEQLGLI